MIEQIFLLVILFGLGFFSGYFANKEKIHTLTEPIQTLTNNTTNHVKGLVQSKPLTIPTGVIRPQSAQQIALKRERPDRVQAQQEMKKALDQNPDLLKARLFIEQQKKWKQK